MDQPLNIAVIVLQLVVALATIAAALATRSQAKVTERAFQQGLRTLLRTRWEVKQIRPDLAAVTCSIGETAGVLTEVRDYDIDIRFARHPDRYSAIDHLDGKLLHQDEEISAVVAIKFYDLATPDFGPLADVDVRLTVSAVGTDDPRVWTLSAAVRYDDGQLVAIGTRSIPAALVDSSPRLRQRVADRWAKWEAWNDRFRAPKA